MSSRVHIVMLERQSEDKPDSYIFLAKFAFLYRLDLAPICPSIAVRAILWP